MNGYMTNEHFCTFRGPGFFENHKGLFLAVTIHRFQILPVRLCRLNVFMEYFQRLDDVRHAFAESAVNNQKAPEILKLVINDRLLICTYR